MQKLYTAWYQDVNAITVDAFTVPWNQSFFYAFPPFSLILRILQKIQVERAERIVVVPNWPFQPWFPLFRSMLTAPPILFPPNYCLLYSADRQPHPLHRRLSLAAGRLSGKLSS